MSHRVLSNFLRAIIICYTRTNSNLDKPFKAILYRAGLIPWPKLFQDMRASCETDWLDSGMAPHVVAKWIGHSVDTQNRHYAQVDDHHFEQFNAEAKKVAHYVAHKTCEMAPSGSKSKT